MPTKMLNNADPAFITNNSPKVELVISEGEFIHFFGSNDNSLSGSGNSQELSNKDLENQVVLAMQGKTISYDAAKSALALAAKENHLNKVKLLLKPGYGVVWDNYIVYEGLLNNGLCAAVVAGHSDIVDYLLSSPELTRNAKISDKAYRVLARLIQYDKFEDLNILLGKMEWPEFFNPESLSSIKFGLDYLIMKNGTSSLVKEISYLLFHDLLKDKWRQDDIQDLFLASARSGSIDNMEFLISHPNLKYRAIPQKKSTTAWFQSMSAVNGIFNFSLRLSLDIISYKNSNNNKKEKIPLPEEAFLNVCESGSVEALKYLCDKGVKPHSYGLIIASHMGHFDIIKAMLQQDPHLNAQIWNNKAIILAANHTSTDIVQYLLSSTDFKPENRANPFDNNNALFKKACTVGNLDLAKYLVSHYHVLPETESPRNLFFMFGYPKNSINAFLKNNNFSIKKEIVAYMEETLKAKQEKEYLSTALSLDKPQIVQKRKSESTEEVSSTHEAPKKPKINKI